MSRSNTTVNGQQFLSLALWGSLLVSLTSPAVVSAQNPSGAARGRLPDGRAYRVDPASGMRLSDYVAELEVTTDDLKRQNVALEDEVSEKRRQIEQYARQTGVTIAPKIKESTLVDKGLPPAKSAPIACSPMDPQVVALQTRIKTLEASLGGAAGSESPASAMAKCDYNTPANPLYTEVLTLKRTLADNVSAKEGSDASHQQLAALEQQLTAVNKQLVDKQGQIDQLQQRLAQTEVKTEPRGRQTAPIQAALPIQEAPPVAVAVAPAPVTNLADKNELNAMLTRVQALVIQRKDLLDAVKAKGKGVVVPIQPLVTKGRVTLDDIRTNVQRFQPGQDPAGTKASINEVEQILKDDIAVLSRLSR